jgi:hypothetical protein
MTFGDSMRRAMDSELIEPPKGPYKVKVEEASAFEGKDGRQWAKLILTITDGDHAGENFQHFMGFQPESIKQMNGNALAAYGVDWADVHELSDLDDQMLGLVGRLAEVSVAYKDGYMNVNVHGSRPPEGKVTSDIPSDPDTARMTPEQQDTFAAAAQRFGSDVPF